MSIGKVEVDFLFDEVLFDKFVHAFKLEGLELNLSEGELGDSAELSEEELLFERLTDD